MWKTEWLRRPGDRATAGAGPVSVGRISPAEVPGTGPDGAPMVRYACQFTALHAASRPIRSGNMAKELRPWIAGNITAATLLVGLGTRLFNRIQARRGGIGFPVAPPPTGDAQATPVESLAVGDRVRVRPIEEISRTLNRNSRNMGCGSIGT